MTDENPAIGRKPIIRSSNDNSDDAFVTRFAGMVRKQAREAFRELSDFDQGVLLLLAEKKRLPWASLFRSEIEKVRNAEKP